MIEITRQKPKNLKACDNDLFQHELKTVIPDHKVVKLWCCRFDIFTFTAYSNREKFESLQLRYGYTNRRFLGKHKISFVYKAYIILDHWSANYFHWVTEVLPKIFILIEKEPTVSLLIPDWLFKYSFIEETVKRIPQLKYKIISNRNPFFILRGIAVDLKLISGNYNPVVLQQVHSFFKKSIQVQKKETAQRIFIYRSITHGRGIINFEEVLHVLKKYNIQVVDFAELNWLEQFELMQNTSLLIGVHGAGLTNMMFMPTSSKVVELRKKGDATNNCYFSMASALNHGYWYILCDVDNAEEVTQKNNFYLDNKALETILIDLIN